MMLNSRRADMSRRIVPAVASSSKKPRDNSVDVFLQWANAVIAQPILSQAATARNENKKNHHYSKGVWRALLLVHTGIR